MVVEVVVAYDVGDDDRRSRVAAYLSRTGVRLQQSVFQCRVPRGGADTLVEGVAALIDERTDVVHVFVQCADCRSKAVQLGQAPPDLGVRYWVV
jgi:CRISPR-associated protein Cas2